MCRRRGGDYGYTCIYDAGSEACTRCIKEKHRCRTATAEQIAKSEARCQQCKARGLANCDFEDGKTMCEQCIKHKKQCGAPVKRQFNNRTRAFLGLNTPEPEPDTEPIPVEANVNANVNVNVNVNETEYREIANGLRRIPSLPAQPQITTPSWTQRASQESRAAISHALETEVTRSSALSDRDFSTAKVEKSSRTDANRKTRTSSRLSHTHNARDGYGCTSVTPGHIGDEIEGHADGSPRRVSLLVLTTSKLISASHRPSKTSTSAKSNSTVLRGCRGIDTRKKTFASQVTIQEATPDDSAEEGTEPPVVDLEIGDDEGADVQLHAESNSALRLSPVPGTGSEAEVVDNPAAGAKTLRPRHSRARPSYVEFAPSDGSEQDSAEDDDEGWDPLSADEKSEVDDDAELSENSESSAVEDEEEVDFDAMVIEPEPAPSVRRKSQPVQAPKQGKGIDLNLPPMNNILSISEDMASKAIGLGLCDALRKLAGRPMNVATMCSGTESPLLFLQLLSDALVAKGEPSLNVRHQFSAEIDATKQAYIERNFHPPILFRDVRQLGDETCATATTAYGAEEQIPGDLDILIAGFVCKDLSSLNSRKKTVDDQGETGDTWRAICYYVKQFQPSIVLLENVRSDKNVWNDVVSRWSKIGYEAAWVYCDTKNYYLPQTRERMYMIAINRKLYGKNVSDAVTQWQSTMGKLQRQCSSPYEAFLVDLPVSVVNHSTLSSEPEWSLAKLRYDQIRSEQRLGIRRPITQWSENGTLR